MALAPVTLDDKYALESGRVFLTGTQALVRLPMMQRRRDEAAGLNTGCFISGYRGSPLGLVDQQLWQARSFLEKHHIQFQPGVNEDLAATAILGTQQLDMSIGAKYDGVFSMWYAKGPGVDRSGDILRHGNLFGSAPTGGVLLLAGDDHTCKSSTTAHQTEYAFMDAMIPVLNPAGVQEFLDLGLYGWAMSRYSGCWTAFKLIAETVDSSASVYVDPHRVDIKLPEDFEMPEGGLSIRYPDTPLEMEDRLHRYKIHAVLAFARANKLDKAVIDGPNRRFGIVTCGKSYLDVRQALEELGINEDYARAIGLSIYKVGMTWPLERDGIREFCEGLDEVLVVEEKRALIENQLKEQLYNWRADKRPRVIGKFDEKGEWILPSIGELTPTQIARVIARRLEQFHSSSQIDDRIKFLDSREKSLLTSNTEGFQRTPYFCSGCPHNSSTKVPEGSRALSGIGCHFMAQWMERNTATFTHMGAEGVPWVGISPFTEEEHVFANIGDGTYYHSGLMAIRQAIAANVNMTYKILFNDAVAMTGGQPHDGPLTVPAITQQVKAEGASRVVVVTDEPDKYPRDAGFAANTKIFHRDDLMLAQKELRAEKGVSVLVYDQTCAAEKRRRRRRGTFPDPLKRVMINDLVCEGCGDCSVKSNCLSVVPKETEFGRKRTIDQSSCNKDYSCVNGFCPSFVTVHGTDLKKPRTSGQEVTVPDIFEALPEPTIPSTADPYGMLVTGIGGTGVVTIGAIIAMAAHIEGKGCSVLDMVGLAQKGGAVLTHIRVADSPEDLHAVRIAAGGAKMMLGCDIVTAASFDALSKIDPGETRAVVNSHQTITGDFTRDPDMTFPGDELHQSIAKVVGAERTEFLEATKLATALLGNSIASNMFMLGCAWQKGLVPVSMEALFQAIELNAVAVDSNKQAFTWGRRAAHDLELVRKMASTDAEPEEEAQVAEETLVGLVERRVQFLAEYQNERLARRYKDFVVQVQTSEAHRVQGEESLSMAVARYYFKLLAYKDEYEVARLHTATDFLAEVGEKFESGFKLKYHLAPPLLARRDPDTGLPRKMEVGEWILPAFRALARLKFLRGTPFDVFGYTAERKRERQLIKDYEATIEELLRDLTPENHRTGVEIASLPEQIRGYGHVKEASIVDTKSREIELLGEFRNPSSATTVAAE